MTGLPRLGRLVPVSAADGGRGGAMRSRPHPWRQGVLPLYLPPRGASLFVQNSECGHGRALRIVTLPLPDGTELRTEGSQADGGTGRPVSEAVWGMLAGEVSGPHSGPPLRQSTGVVPTKRESGRIEREAWWAGPCERVPNSSDCLASGFLLVTDASSVARRHANAMLGIWLAPEGELGRLRAWGRYQRPATT